MISRSAYWLDWTVDGWCRRTISIWTFATILSQEFKLKRENCVEHQLKILLSREGRSDGTNNMDEWIFMFCLFEKEDVSSHIMIEHFTICTWARVNHIAYIYDLPCRWLMTPTTGNWYHHTDYVKKRWQKYIIKVINLYHIRNAYCSKISHTFCISTLFHLKYRWEILSASHRFLNVECFIFC